MKTEIKLNYFVSFLLFFIVVTFFSCTKKDETTTTTDTPQVTESNEFTESNEDLLKVDYDYFYKELSPHGEWVEINAKELGLDIKPGTTSIEGNTGYNFALDILGINTAYAQTDEQLLNIFVWRPATELVSAMINESPEKQYSPYNNGDWVYTDAGWYFKANTPQEDLTSHYGRWALDPNLGWVWLPGKVWSPAWVEWRENDDYVAWAPVPPGVYIQNNAVNVTTINENRFTIVEKKHFIEPSVYKYRYQYVENKNKIMIKEMIKKEGVIIKNKTVINKGPDVEVIEKSSNKKIEQVKIKKTGKKEEAGSTGNTINVYTPEFKQEKEAGKKPVSKPEKLVSYKDAKKITKDEKEVLKENDKLQKEQEKELKKEEKKSDKELKKENKENEKKEKEKDKDKGKDKEKKNDKDDKVKDQKDKNKK